MKKLLLASLFLVACNADVLHLNLFDETDPRLPNTDFELTEEVEEACEILSLVCVPDNDGDVTLVLQESNNGLHGRELEGDGCHRIAWAEPDDPFIIAHELGHLFLGSDHSNEKNNLMANPPGTELTSKQTKKVERVVRRLSLCP